MQVFIDSNILLNFFHFSKDELDALNNVFASHEHGAATVHLTEQVKDEFSRNREAKIKDALKRFEGAGISAQLPSFMKAYPEFDQIKKLAADLQSKAKAIMARATVDITGETLLADKLIAEIFSKSKAVATTDGCYEAAVRRMALGNPPGKNKSLGARSIG